MSQELLRITVRLSPQEKTFLDQTCAETGVSRNTYIRNCIKKQPERTFDAIIKLTQRLEKNGVI